MTFTIAARCPRTGQAGIASATVSLAVGGLCPWFTSHGDILSSQAFVSKRDGYLMTLAMESGKTAEEAIAIPQEQDVDITFRQLLILPRSVDATGNGIMAYTGGMCRSWAGHRVGDNFVVAGNVLAGAHVVDAMVDSINASMELDLDVRLLIALEAGRDAGGQALPDGTAITERSASLKVLGAGEDAGMHIVDFRVDMHGSAVHELRRIFEVNRVYGPYSEKRDIKPRSVQSIMAYEAEQLPKGGVFATRPSCYR